LVQKLELQESSSGSTDQKRLGEAGRAAELRRKLGLNAANEFAFTRAAVELIP
jgi:hypothetical protein